MDGLPITYRGVVYPWHLDHMGHMNVQHYVGMFDQALWALLTLIGFTPERFRAEGLGAAALEQHIRYHRELVAGDAVELRSGVLELRDKVFRVLHRMRKSATGDLAAQMEITGIFIDTAARKSVALPSLFRERAAAYHVPGDSQAAARPRRGG